MKKWHMYSLGAALALCLAAATPAKAYEIYENFDIYPAGTQLHGVAGWQGWDNAATAGALVSSAFSYSSPNSVNITGDSDLVHRFYDMTSGLWYFSIRQYIPSTSSGTSYFILLNRYNPGGSNDDNWAVQIQYNMATGMMVSDNGAGATLPFVRNQWADLRFVINLTANTVSEWYNGTLLSTHTWATGGPIAIGAVDLYANAAGPVYYDDLRLTNVPEPTTVALLALFGALGAVWTRRNRS